MNAVGLVQHFEQISEAPEAVPRLRRFILDLAVRGKLVEQNPKDEPASELMKRIRAAKTTGVDTKKKQMALPKIEDSGVPFSLPGGWQWNRFGSIHELVRGVTYTKSDVSETLTPGNLPILRANNIGASLNFEDLVFVRKECVSSEQLLRRGDYLIALSSGSKNLVGKAAFVAADYAGGFGGFCGVLRLVSPSIELFVGIFLSSRLYRDAISEGSRGIGINNLKRETLNNILFPLPPLAEQQRIVAKVKELMKLCDELEAVTAKREARRDRLVASTLHGLNNGDTRAESDNRVSFAATARFYFNHLPRLTTRPEHIKQLRQTILNLAVRGKLVLQDPHDEPAAELLKRIHADKKRLVEEGGIKANTSLPGIRHEEQPFELPQTWRWVRWDTIALKIGDIDHKMPDAVTKGIPYVSPRDFLPNNKIDFNHAKQVSIEDFIRLSAKIKPEAGDLIYPRYGTIGENRLVQVHRDFLVSYSCAVVKVLHAFISPSYQYIFSISDVAQDQAKSAENKATQPNVGLNSIKQFFFPLPPFAEQHRIVAKVDELMALCDELEVQLTTTAATGRQLLEAILNETLAPASEGQRASIIPQV
jgi:type I restriction enzyme S subunit